MRKRARLSAALAGLAALLIAGPVGNAQSASDYQVEAAFLFNIAKFVQWPDNSFPDANAPFTICVIGQDPFGDALDSVQSIGSRAVEVDRYPSLRNVNEAQYCQIAFVSSSEKSRFRKIIGLFEKKSVLLVADSAGFASSGGSVEFRMEEGHVRLAVNPESASRAHLTVSSKLLAIAEIVHSDSSQAKN